MAAKAGDDAFLACFCEETKSWICKTELAKRKTGNCNLDVGVFQGKQVHVYFGFVSQARKLNSDSRYLGMVKVL